MTIVCLVPELHRVFTQFCRELAESVEHVPSPAREAADAFERWRDLFSEALAPDLLGEEELVGLVGELIAVEDVLTRGASGDLDFWVGPLNHVHDLRTPSHAIEVKATLVREGRIVSISSVDQLQPPVGATLVLRHMRLERDPSGFDLRMLMARVIAAGADRTELARKLRAVGVNIDEVDAYRRRTYRLVETRFYDVTAEAFPRILRSSFSDGDVPVGTLRLAYAIDLTNEPPHPMTAVQSQQALNDFAEEASRGLDT